MNRNFYLYLYPILFLLFSIYTYTRVDPNVVLSSHPLIVSIQGAFRNFGYEERLLSSIVFTVLVILLFLTYLKLIQLIQSKAISNRLVFTVFLASIAVLFLSFPSLSHDIFNYLFNAKMVLEYKANPHILTAQDFPNDPWLIFMHNSHTPAPYGYGWTALSLIPYWLGQGHFKITIWLFRLLMTASLVGLVWFQRKILTGTERRNVALFALNPLILIETVSSIHNDVIMILPAWVGGYLGLKAYRSWKHRWLFIPAGLLFALSVSIKYATIVLVGGLIFYHFTTSVKRAFSFGGAHALSLSALLFTDQSKRFLPWYLFWPLSFLPLIQEQWLKNGLLVFSFTSLLSYIPFLYLPESTQFELYRTLVIFIPALTIIGIQRLLTLTKRI